MVTFSSCLGDEATEVVVVFEAGAEVVVATGLGAFGDVVTGFDALEVVV